jgi:hypothetical protein
VLDENHERVVKETKKTLYIDTTNVSTHRVKGLEEDVRGLCTTFRVFFKIVTIVFCKKDDYSCIMHESTHAYQIKNEKTLFDESLLTKEAQRINKRFGGYLNGYYTKHIEIDARLSQYSFEDLNEGLERTERV